ncbi:hypothetical protein D3C73_1499550 [compost metagenome]
MLFLTQEELSRAPDDALAKATEFLDVAPLAPATPVRVNMSRWTENDVLSDEDRAYLDRLYADDQALFREMTGLSLESE